MTELQTALELFRSGGDEWGESFTLVTIGRGALLAGDGAGALAGFETSLRLARSQNDRLSEGIALNHIAWAHFLLGDTAASATAFAESLDISITLEHTEGVAYGLEGFVAIAASLGLADKAGTLTGAAESLRRTTGLFNSPSFSFHEQALAPILAGDHADQFQAARREGLRMKLHDAIDYAKALEATA
jgi:hypothetical protein